MGRRRSSFAAVASLASLASLALSFAACGSEAETDGSGSEGESEETGAQYPDGCENGGTPGATLRCLSPTQTPEYYIEQAEFYFDTLDTSAPRENVPNYHPKVARWEWPPWLLLTGYGATPMIEGNDALRSVDPSTVPFRDCRFFEVQPFARCYVEFDYEAGTGPCRIYEEFSFNDAGETTFIEAWSDLPEFSPLTPDDLWAEDPDFPRMATRVPGLGTPSGNVDLQSMWMLEAAAADPELADYAMRASDWVKYWLEEIDKAADDYFAVGCAWP